MKTLRFAIFIVLMTLPLMGGASEEKDNEQIAGLLARISSFVEWPGEKADLGDGRTFFIGCVGSTSLCDAVSALSDDALNSGAKIKVRKVDARLLPANAHVLVISESDQGEIARIVEKLKGTGTLLVSKGEGLGKLGTILNFFSVTEDGETSVKPEVNLAAAEDQGLKIKDIFLNIARKVE